ncbi:MAG TPA: hypothetical protein DEH78_23415 [Solibacterales bacterium]|nr:hypothetical protein [Bryobacterales bacterium]
MLWVLLAAAPALVAQTIAPSSLHGAVPLAGVWKSNPGDDPRRVERAFNDSTWTAVTMPRPAARGAVGYTWYRLQVRVPASAPPLYVMVGPLFPAYEIFANGQKIGSFGGPLGTAAGQILAEPAMFPLPDSGTGEYVIALRTYEHGLVDGPQRASAEASQSWIGSQRAIEGEMARWQLDRMQRSAPIRALVVSLGLSALFFLSIPLWRRGSPEYLWLGLWLSIVAARRLVLMVPEAIGWHSRLWRGYFNSGSDTITIVVEVFFWATLFRQRPSWVSWTMVALEVLSEWALPRRVTPLLMVAMLVIYLDFCWRHYRRADSSGESLWPLHVGFSLYWVPTMLYNLIHLGGEPDTPSPWDIAMRSSTLAFVFAMAVILNRRSARTEREQQRLEQEMSAARTFQELLVQGEVSGVEAVYLPAREVGGDFYQVVQREGARLVLVGDVSGKGLEAAMVASEAVGAFRSTTSVSPREILQTLNRALCGQGRRGFVTCLCARVEEGGRMTLATAGHPAPYVDGEEFNVPGGLPLGISADAEYEEFPREAAHQITFFSDGVVEAADRNGVLFGFDRMAAIASRSAREIAEAARDWGHNDDITVVTVRRQR